MRTILYTTGRALHYFPKKNLLILLPVPVLIAAAALLALFTGHPFSPSDRPLLLLAAGSFFLGQVALVAALLLGRSSRSQPLSMGLIAIGLILALTDPFHHGWDTIPLLLVLAIAYASSLTLWYVFFYSVRRSPLVKHRPGDPFPEFSLSDSEGNTVGLSDLRGKRVLFVLYRGDW